MGCTLSLKAVTDLGDLMILAMALPNMLALYILHSEVKLDLRHYLDQLKKI
jgi:Na+/alanine symporter